MELRPTSPTRPITPDCHRNKHHTKFGVWQKIQNLFSRDGLLHGVDLGDNMACWPSPELQTLPKQGDCSSARPVGIGLPRQATFKRQNSEKRERLCAVETSANERRAYSTSRPVSRTLTKFRSNSLPPKALPNTSSTLDVRQSLAAEESNRYNYDFGSAGDQPYNSSDQPIEYDRVRPPRPTSVTSSLLYTNDRDYVEERNQLNRELDTKWILNLSMHFRDKSDREKFFVTYAETPTRWRRLTISCDYRHAEPGSIELDLKELQLQRDKSMQIYEAIRESLLDIKFYDTVTNLKLETTDGRLHVHVTEDVNDIIPYPPISSLNHLLRGPGYRPKRVRESELSFEAHLSGFVYKVLYQDRPYIKKEIPSPDTVDEFLYEVNALHALHDSQYVIDLEAIVTDDSGQLIKGLLINYAERGAVVDLLYDYKGELPWELRERWARHAIQGLSHVHEEGYVQGDFTLSNVVVDAHNNARIIDINRRGCPVGWEPPEIAQKIASNQRISMFIGEKSDIYQLGMTLWALAMDDDEPERHDPPLSTQEFPSEVPLWYQEIVRICLSLRPRDRLSATDLVKLLPVDDQHSPGHSRHSRPVVRIRTEKQYIDPAAAVERDDIERLSDNKYPSDEPRCSPQSSRDDPTFTYPQSSSNDRDYDSASSDVVRPRGRRRVSDHDVELRAQRRNESTQAEYPVINGIHNGSSLPVISISSDGTEAHVLDLHGLTSDQQEHGSVADHNVNHDVDLDDAPFGTWSSASAIHDLADRILFPSHSEVSDDTPRNSCLQLFGQRTQSPDQFNDLGSEGYFPDDLTGLGSNPEVGHQSFERYHRDMRRESEYGGHSHLPSPIPADSGYGDSLILGLEDELNHVASIAKGAGSGTSLLEQPEIDQPVLPTGPRALSPARGDAETLVIEASNPESHQHILKSTLMPHENIIEVENRNDDTPAQAADATRTELVAPADSSTNADTADVSLDSHPITNATDPPIIGDKPLSNEVSG